MPKNLMQTGMYWRLSGFYFTYFVVLGIMVPYFPLYLKSLGMDAWHIGLLTSVLIGTKIVAPNLWGWLADHSQQRMLIIRLGCLLAPLCFMLIFWRRDFPFLVLIIFAYSFFWNAVLAQFEAVTLFYLAKQPEQYSRVRLWGSVGFIVSVTGLGWYFDRATLEAFPILILLGSFAIFASSWLVPDPDPALAFARKNNDQSFFTRLRQPHIVVFFSVCFLMVLSHGPYYTFFSVLMEQNAYSHTTIGLLWSLGVLAEVVMFWFMHRLLPRFGLRSLLLVSLLLTAMRWLLLALFPQQFGLMLFGQCLHAFSFGAFHSSAIEIVRRWFSLQQSGKAQAFYSAVSFGAGNALGALMSGALWELNSTLPFLFSSIVCLFGACLVWRYLHESCFIRLENP
jgi:PPP family 3-phenylpropionic acid transporter